MRNTLVGIVAVVVLVGGGWYVYQNKGGAAVGEYAYVCDNGSSFSMTPSPDMSFITAFAGAQGMFTGKVVLNKMGDANHYESGPTGTLVTLSGAGEEMQLTVGSQSTVCNPVPSQDMAPWNWGDTGEGGGSMQPDVRLVVGESIMGTWQSNEDAKFSREFAGFAEANLSGTVVDRYEGAQVSTGTYAVFTKDNPLPGITIPLEDNIAYVRLTMSGSQAETLTFKVTTLTPETLEMIYLDRGGVQTYTLVE